MQDVKEEPQEASGALTPEDDDECYFEEDAIDEGMVRHAVFFFFFGELFNSDALCVREMSLYFSNK